MMEMLKTVICWLLYLNLLICWFWADQIILTLFSKFTITYVRVSMKCRMQNRILLTELLRRYSLIKNTTSTYSCVMTANFLNDLKMMISFWLAFWHYFLMILKISDLADKKLEMMWIRILISWHEQKCFFDIMMIALSHIQYSHFWYSTWKLVASMLKLPQLEYYLVNMTECVKQ